MPRWLSKRAHLIALASVLALALTLPIGCGYKIGYRTGDFPPAYRMGVSAFSNATFKPGLESLARDTLLRCLSERKFPLSTSHQNADWILSGRVVGYSTEPVAFDVQDISRQYRLTISIGFTLKEGGGQKLLWDEILSASSYYYTGPNVASTETSENHASVKALEEISQLVAARLQEGP